MKNVTTFHWLGHANSYSVKIINILSICLLLFFIGSNSILNAQIGICWKTSQPPLEVGDGALTPIPNHSSSSLPINVSNTEIHVYGNYTLDVNNTTFTNCEFVLYAGATMFIPNNNTIRFTSSSLEGCFSLWQGIIVQSQGRIIMQYCDVSDAEEAVRLNPASLGAFFSNNFDRNWISISAPNGDFTDYVWNNNFTCSSALSQPRAGQFSWAGISVANNVIDVTTFIGGNSWFDGLQNGIVSIESIVNCNNCIFSNIFDDPGNRLGIGTGISATQNSQILVENSSFNEVHTGIYLNESSINLNNSTFSDGHIVVRSENFSDPHLVVVFDNVFNPTDIGVEVRMEGSGHIDIRDNTMTSDDPGFTMVDIFSAGVSNDIVRVNNNVITNTNTEQRAIFLRNCNRAEVNGNTLDYTVGFGSYTGIGLRNCESSTVSNNDVFGSVDTIGNTRGFSMITTPLTEFCCNGAYNLGTGIQFKGNCDNTDFNQNEVQGNNVGLSILELFDFQTQMFISGAIGTQSFSGNEWLDLSAVFNASNDSDPSLSTFVVLNSVLPVHPVSENAPGGNWFVVNQLGGHANCASSANCGPSGGGDPFSPGDELVISSNPIMADGGIWHGKTVLLDRMHSDPSLHGINNNFDSWYATVVGSDLDELLSIQNDMKNDLVMTVYEEQQWNQIKQNIASLGMQQFDTYVDWINNEINESAFNSLIAGIQTNLDAEKGSLNNLHSTIKAGIVNRAMIIKSNLEALNLSHPIALVQHDVMELLLLYLIQGGSLNQAEESSMNALANLCHYEYGQSIHWARSVMSHLTGALYADNAGCTSALPNGDKEKAKSYNDLIYPNPVGNILYVGSDVSKVVVFDILQKSYTWSVNNRKIQVGHLVAGTYFISTYNSDSQLIGTTTFVKL